MMNSHNKVISGILFKTYTGIAEYEEINSEKIIKVIDATLPLYLTIHMVILQFPQHLLN